MINNNEIFLVPILFINNQKFVVTAKIKTSEITYHITLRARSSAIDFTQLEQQKSFGTK